MIREKSFQQHVVDWGDACFGKDVVRDRSERACRFLEESLELFQAADCTKEDALALVDYVYGREKGEIGQEIGGTALTLAALCEAFGFDLEACSEIELQRVWGKIDQIRKKQASKPHNSPLPGASS